MRFVGHGIVSGFHGSIILVSLVFQAWWLAIVISGFNFIGNWLGYFVCPPARGAQGQRLGFQTVYPRHASLYWRMNYHAEHHLYAGVPCYKLKRLSEVIAEDMPEQKTPIGAWREMRETMKRQQTDPEYQSMVEHGRVGIPGNFRVLKVRIAEVAE